MFEAFRTGQPTLLRSHYKTPNIHHYQNGTRYKSTGKIKLNISTNLFESTKKNGCLIYLKRTRIKTASHGNFFIFFSKANKPTTRNIKTKQNEEREKKVDGRSKREETNFINGIIIQESTRNMNNKI